MIIYYYYVYQHGLFTQKLYNTGNYKTSKRLKTSIQNVKRVATSVLDSYNGICHNIGRPEACIKYQEICNLQQIPLKHLTPMCLVELV